MWENKLNEKNNQLRFSNQRRPAFVYQAYENV